MDFGQPGLVRDSLRFGVENWEDEKNPGMGALSAFATASSAWWERDTSSPDAAGNRGEITCVFPRVVGLPLEMKESASSFIPRILLHMGEFTQLQIFLSIETSEFARLPCRSYRCE